MKQILVAEDDQTIRKMYKTLLESSGKYQVHTEISGNEAFQYLEETQNQVDAIVTDFEMPNGNGLELTRNARKSSFEGPIVLISGAAEEKEVLEAGADKFLLKPAKFTDILATLDELLAQ